ncbi:polymer-forming cytoskeletal protein [bacterium BFN5]|nr:polymer-forming cytoskeletal protein [bacterium BFN5]QJW46717.1 polymer-forming cytoskeletal protein [bacterium BFN5]
MFGSKKIRSSAIGEIETIIGKDTQLKGSVKAQGTIRIDGEFEGDIDSEQDIIIGESGRVTAKINARNVLISGVLQGNVNAAGRLELMSSGKLYGDIKANALIIGEGAVFKGVSDMIDTSGNKSTEKYQDGAASA